MPLPLDVADLPAVNATLNALATVLLVVGYALMRRGRIAAHKWTMISAFGTSVVFLVCYLIYHAQVGSRPFPGVGPIHYVYFGILVTHIILAVTVPVLAPTCIYLGLRDRIAAHRRLARWTFPIWLYVSITGVVIYLMLYQMNWSATSS